MTTNRRSERVPSRTPPFVLVGLVLVLGFLGYSYWSLSSANSDLVSQLEAVNVGKKDIETKHSDLKKQLESSKAHLVSFQLEANELKENVEARVSEINSLKADGYQKSADNEKQRSLLEQCDEKLSVLQKDLDSVNYEKSNLQLTLDAEREKAPVCSMELCESSVRQVLEIASKLVGSSQLKQALVDAQLDGEHLMRGIDIPAPENKCLNQQPPQDQQEQPQQHRLDQQETKTEQLLQQQRLQQQEQVKQQGQPQPLEQSLLQEQLQHEENSEQQAQRQQPQRALQPEQQAMKSGTAEEVEKTADAAPGVADNMSLTSGQDHASASLQSVAVVKPVIPGNETKAVYDIVKEQHSALSMNEASNGGVAQTNNIERDEHPLEALNTNIEFEGLGQVEKINDIPQVKMEANKIEPSSLDEKTAGSIYNHPNPALDNLGIGNSKKELEGLSQFKHENEENLIETEVQLGGNRNLNPSLDNLGIGNIKKELEGLSQFKHENEENLVETEVQLGGNSEQQAQDEQENTNEFSQQEADEETNQYRAQLRNINANIPNHVAEVNSVQDERSKMWDHGKPVDLDSIIMHEEAKSKELKFEREGNMQEGGHKDLGPVGPAGAVDYGDVDGN